MYPNKVLSAIPLAWSMGKLQPLDSLEWGPMLNLVFSPNGVGPWCMIAHGSCNSSALGGNRSHPLPLILSVAAGLAFV
jgi:hypothetical protein